MVPQVHQGFVTPDRQILTQAPCRRVFLLRGHKLRSRINFQVARKPSMRVSVFRDRQFFSEHCQVPAFHVESILTQSEDNFHTIWLL